MEEFEYADKQVSDREIMIAVASMVIGIGVLSLPSDLAAVTKFADGWIVIVIGGVLATLITWLGAKLAASFPHQSFISYASLIATKPVAIMLTLSFSMLWLLVTAFQVRKMADLAVQYNLPTTPKEVVALVFFLIVIYAVSGSTVGLLRLNIMFLPIIIFISLIIIAFNIKWFSSDSLFPIFQTSLNGYGQGVSASILSYSGFSIVLFYISLVKKPKKTATKAAMGMLIPIGLYVLIFLSALSVFGHSVTKDTLNPTIQLALNVDIPGGLLERFESVFFVIWTMAIFNTTAMALDIAVISINSVFRKASNIKILFLLAPIIYFISMFPNDLLEVSAFGIYVSRMTSYYSLFVIVLLITIAKLRGMKRVNE